MPRYARCRDRYTNPYLPPRALTMVGSLLLRTSQAVPAVPTLLVPAGLATDPATLIGPASAPAPLRWSRHQYSPRSWIRQAPHFPVTRCGYVSTSTWCASREQTGTTRASRRLVCTWYAHQGYHGPPGRSCSHCIGDGLERAPQEVARRAERRVQPARGSGPESHPVARYVIHPTLQTVICGPAFLRHLPGPFVSFGAVTYGSRRMHRKRSSFSDRSTDTNHKATDALVRGPALTSEAGPPPIVSPIRHGWLPPYRPVTSKV
jgi:hypothetical protein